MPSNNLSRVFRKREALARRDDRSKPARGAMLAANSSGAAVFCEEGQHTWA
jgi:hypothetical protein